MQAGNTPSQFEFTPTVTPNSFKTEYDRQQRAKISKAIKKKETNYKPVKLEESAKDVLEYLSSKGKASFKDITETLNLPYRRTSDILNVLATTPLVDRIYEEDSRNRKGNFQPKSYTFCNGIPLDGIALKSCVDVKSVEELIENEKLKIQELLSRRN